MYADEARRFAEEECSFFSETFGLDEVIGTLPARILRKLEEDVWEEHGRPRKTGGPYALRHETAIMKAIYHDSQNYGQESLRISPEIYGIACMHDLIEDDARVRRSVTEYYAGNYGARDRPQRERDRVLGEQVQKYSAWANVNLKTEEASSARRFFEHVLRQSMVLARPPEKAYYHNYLWDIVSSSAWGGLQNMLEGLIVKAYDRENNTADLFTHYSDEEKAILREYLLNAGEEGAKLYCRQAVLQDAFDGKDLSLQMQLRCHYRNLLFSQYVNKRLLNVHAKGMSSGSYPVKRDDWLLFLKGYKRFLDTWRRENSRSADAALDQTGPDYRAALKDSATNNLMRGAFERITIPPTSFVDTNRKGIIVAVPEMVHGLVWRLMQFDSLREKDGNIYDKDEVGMIYLAHDMFALSVIADIFAADKPRHFRGAIPDKGPTYNDFANHRYFTIDGLSDKILAEASLEPATA